MPSPNIDHEQAAQLAASLVDPELVTRCRRLGEELDDITRRALALQQPLRAALEELGRRDEEGFLARGHAILHGRDTSMTYLTLVRAEELLRSWSGEDALAARAYRLTNVLLETVGEESLVDSARIEGWLAEERGR